MSKGHRGLALLMNPDAEDIVQFGDDRNNPEIWVAVLDMSAVSRGPAEDAVFDILHNNGPDALPSNIIVAECPPKT